MGIRMTEETVLHGDIGLAADDDVRVLVLQVGEEVEGEDYRAVGRVLEGNDAAVGSARLNRGEDVVDGDDGGEGKV